jgi:CRISPR system Cascade subunit CasB
MRKPDKFSTHISQLDAVGRSMLRKSLNFPPGEWPPAFPYVEPHIITLGADERKIAYVVAGLQALSRAPEASGNFGEAAKRLQHATNSRYGEWEFLKLIDANDKFLYRQLRRMVTLMSSHGIAPDWGSLRRDLNRWRHPDRIVQIVWARSYYLDQ